MKRIVAAVACLCLSAAPAWAAYNKNEPTTPAPVPTVEPPITVTAPAPENPAREIRVQTVQQAPDIEELDPNTVVCRTERPMGSNIRQRVCMRVSETLRSREEGKRSMKALDARAGAMGAAIDKGQD
jgi:hypothetical protein